MSSHVIEPDQLLLKKITNFSYLHCKSNIACAEHMAEIV